MIKRKSRIFKILNKLEIFLYKKSELIISVLPYAVEYKAPFNICENKVLFT